MSAFMRRLNEAMQSQNLRQAELLRLTKPLCEAYHIKLGKSELSQYVNGKVTPGESKLFILAQALGVSETWLSGRDNAEVSQESSCKVIYHVELRSDKG